MTGRPRTLILGAMLEDSLALPSAGGLLRRAMEVQALGVDMMVIGLAARGLDPLVVAGWLAPHIREAGLVAVVPALTTLPFHAARALSALDFMTGGHLGWLPNTLGHEDVASGFGVHMDVPAEERCAKALDFIRATTRLWESWDEDALIIDAQSGVYLDSARVRRVNYRGPYFQVMGPLNAARPPQGTPVLVQTDADELWLDTADRSDVLLIADPTAEKLHMRRKQIADAGGTARLLACMHPVPHTIDDMQRWFDAGLIDGVQLGATVTAQLGAEIEILRRRGLIGARPAATSLRSRLGLVQARSVEAISG